MAVGALGGISLLVGSVAGLLGGLTCAALIHTFVPLLPVHSPWSFVVLAELLALVIGILASILSARQAALLDPLEALRSE